MMAITLEMLAQSIEELKTTLYEKLELNKNDVTAKVVALENTVATTSNELNDAILHIRNHVFNLLREENVCLRDRVRILENRVVKVERQVNRVEQNGRKNNLEFDGIPQSINQDKLRETVVKIVNDISDEKIEMKDVEAVHRLHSKRNPKPVIVRMKQNVIDSVRENRRKLKDVGRRLNIQGE